jgi:hypothetical protein
VLPGAFFVHGVSTAWCPWDGETKLERSVALPVLHADRTLGRRLSFALMLGGSSGPPTSQQTPKHYPKAPNKSELGARVIVAWGYQACSRRLSRHYRAASPASIVFGIFFFSSAHDQRRRSVPVRLALPDAETFIRMGSRKGLLIVLVSCAQS